MASNREFNLIDAGPHTGVQTTRTVDNLNNSSAHFVTNITSLSSGQNLSIDVLGVTDQGAEYIIFTSLPMTQEVTHRHLMGPNVSCVPGIACRDFMPKQFKVRITPALPAQTDEYSFDLVLGLA